MHTCLTLTFADARLRASSSERGAAYAFLFPNVMINRYGCALQNRSESLGFVLIGTMSAYDSMTALVLIAVGDRIGWWRRGMIAHSCEGMCASLTSCAHRLQAVDGCQRRPSY